MNKNKTSPGNILLYSWIVLISAAACAKTVSDPKYAFLPDINDPRSTGDIIQEYVEHFDYYFGRKIESSQNVVAFFTELKEFDFRSLQSIFEGFDESVISHFMASFFENESLPKQAERQHMAVWETYVMAQVFAVYARKITLDTFRAKKFSVDNALIKTAYKKGFRTDGLSEHKDKIAIDAHLKQLEQKTQAFVKKANAFLESFLNFQALTPNEIVEFMRLSILRAEVVSVGSFSIFTGRTSVLSNDLVVGRILLTLKEITNMNTPYCEEVIYELSRAILANYNASAEKAKQIWGDFLGPIARVYGEARYEDSLNHGYNLILKFLGDIFSFQTSDKTYIEFFARKYAIEELNIGPKRMSEYFYPMHQFYALDLLATFSNSDRKIVKNDDLKYILENFSKIVKSFSIARFRLLNNLKNMLILPNNLILNHYDLFNGLYNAILFACFSDERGYTGWENVDFVNSAFAEYFNSYLDQAKQGSSYFHLTNKDIENQRKDSFPPNVKSNYAFYKIINFLVNGEPMVQKEGGSISFVDFKENNVLIQEFMNEPFAYKFLDAIRKLQFQEQSFTYRNLAGTTINFKNISPYLTDIHNDLFKNHPKYLSRSNSVARNSLIV